MAKTRLQGCGEVRAVDRTLNELSRGGRAHIYDLKRSEVVSSGRIGRECEEEEAREDGTVEQERSRSQVMLARLSIAKGARCQLV
jgi:hypothetical protein